MTEPSPRATEPTDAVKPPPAPLPDRFRPRVSFGTDPLPNRFSIPAPPGVVPLPNRFSTQLTYASIGAVGLGLCIDTIEQLPVTTEEILSAHDREWVVLILRTPCFYGNHPLDNFLPNLYFNIVKPILKDLDLIAYHQKRLVKATKPDRITNLNKWIQAAQARIDVQRIEVARIVQDNLNLFDEFNRVVYGHFCNVSVQTMPQDMEFSVEHSHRRSLLEPISVFGEYTPYATPETLRRILDRLMVGMASFQIPPVRMQRPSEGEPKMGSNYDMQLRNIRDACAQIHDDPRATPILRFAELGVWDQYPTHKMFEHDFYHLGAHMMRRARDWGWERVRARFAARLTSWAERYPNCRLAIIPEEYFVSMAAHVFPYTPYPN